MASEQAMDIGMEQTGSILIVGVWKKTFNLKSLLFGQNIGKLYSMVKRCATKKKNITSCLSMASYKQVFKQVKIMHNHARCPCITDNLLDSFYRNVLLLVSFQALVRSKW